MVSIISLLCAAVCLWAIVWKKIKIRKCTELIQGEFVGIIGYSGKVYVSINGREYIKVPYEADPNEEEKRIKVDNFVYLYGVFSDLEFYDNGYMKCVIKGTLSCDDGTDEVVLFTVGSEETVLPVGYEEIDVEYPDDCNEDSDEDGCSVYCAVENEEINATASSTLESSGANNYDAQNVCAQDDSQAWVEGAEGSGIGEYIEIKRKLDVSDKAYGIDYTDISIVNGYTKNEEVWKNNNRVKTLAFYYNDTFVLDIELEDSDSPQTISLEEYGIHAASGEEAVFKFVIKDVYKGDKYDDTAITSIVMNFYTPNH